MIRPKILFICSINRMRSKTAEEIYKDDKRFEVKSAGTEPGAIVVLTKEMVEWADLIAVMENHHRNQIRKKFHELYQKKRIVCLHIPDEFDYMQPELIELIKEQFERLYFNETIHLKGKIIDQQD